jgi:hypothetical protein
MTDLGVYRNPPESLSIDDIENKKSILRIAVAVFKIKE